jgi:spermidine synthase
MRGGELISFAETPYGHAAWTRWGNEDVFYENGRIVARSPDAAFAEETAHLPLLLHPHPETVLGIGPEAILAGPEMLRHGIRTLDLVHAEGRTVRFLGGSAAVADPRRWIRRHPGAYDVILCSLPTGDGGASNRFFTREFFLEARRALRPGGVLAFFFPASENRLTATEGARLKGTLAAVSSVFPNVQVLPGDRALVAASDRPIAVDAGTMSARFIARGIKAGTLGPEDFARRFDPERREAFRRRLDALPRARANSDLFPRGVIQAQFAGIEKEFSIGGMLFLCFLGGLGIWAARRMRIKADKMGGLIFVVGFGALAYETALLFLYQAASGALYGELGVLFALFMAGMALGSRVAVGSPGVWAAAWAALAAGSAPIAPSFARAGHPIILFGALLAAAGLLTGGVFAAAARRNPGSAGALYGADSLGASLGAAFAGSVALPWIGIPATLWVIAALTGVGCVVAGFTSPLQKPRW